jgi:hypothetical protein
VILWANPPWVANRLGLELVAADVRAVVRNPRGLENLDALVRKDENLVNLGADKF